MSRVRRRGCALALVAAAAVAAVALPAPAAATIVPGKGMAGVSLRMTESQVRARLGAPQRIERWHGALGSLVTRFHYRWGGVDLEALGARTAPVVVGVWTARAGEKTASGVGVGSPLSSVEPLRGARCWREGSDRYCGIGKRRPLSRFTLFWIGANERVTRISVSLVVNS
jgi:hypothetical protein